VIGTADRPAIAVTVQQLGPAMPARIDERADRPVAPAHDDDGDADELDGEEVAGIRDIVLAADQIPHPQEDRFDLAPEERV
jgi:hypothetical protein